MKRKTTFEELSIPMRKYFKNSVEKAEPVLQWREAAKDRNRRREIRLKESLLWPIDQTEKEELNLLQSLFLGHPLHVLLESEHYSLG